MNFPFQRGKKAPYVRMGDTLILNLDDFPHYTTEEQVLCEMSNHGDVQHFEVSPGYATIQFCSIPDAVFAEKFVADVYEFGAGNMMVPRMMRGGILNAPLEGGEMMSLPVMGNGMMKPSLMAGEMMSSANMTGMGSLQGGMKTQGGSMMRSSSNAQAAFKSLSDTFSQQQALSRDDQAVDRVQEVVSPPNIHITVSMDGSRQVSFSSQTNRIDTVHSPISKGRDLMEDQDRCVLTIGQCTQCQKRTSYTCSMCGTFYCSEKCQAQNWPDHQRKCNSNIPPLNIFGKTCYPKFTNVPVNNSDEKSIRSQRDRRDQHSALKDSPHGKTNQAPVRQSHNRYADAISHTKRVDSSRHGSSSEGDSESQSYNRRNQQLCDHPNLRGDDRSRQNGSGSKFNVRENTAKNSSDRDAKNWQANKNQNCNLERQGCNKALQKDRSKEQLESNKLDDGNKSEGSQSPSSNLPRNSGQGPQIVLRSAAQVPENEKAAVVAISRGGEVDKSCNTSNGACSREQSYFRELHNPTFVPIRNGGTVLMNHFTDSVIYVSSFEPSDIMQMGNLRLKLQEYCDSAKPLTYPPKRKAFVAAKYRMDDVFYRATVEKRLDKVEQKFEVFFVDYGNSDEVTCAELVSLPDELAEVPCWAVPTVLKNVPKEKFSLEIVKDIMKKYCKEQVPLLVKFSGDIAEGVTLIEDDGTSLNAKILDAIDSSVVSVQATPGFVTTSIADRIFFSRLNFVSFPPAGTEVQIVIHSIEEGEGVLMACPLDVTAIDAAVGLEPFLEEHANTTEPYIPVEDELCVVKWNNDVWYRALVLDVVSNDSYIVMFVDYGNNYIVDSSNIRPFKEELLKVKGLANVCCLSGPKLTAQQKAKLKSMERDAWVVTGSLTNCEDGCFYLDIPEIRNQL